MKQKLRSHWYERFLFFIAGIIFLYAPVALFARIIMIFSKTPLIADGHRICLRMPIQWLAQPWMYPMMVKQPMYLVAVLVLPILAFFVAPLFCGWMCPAGQLPEILSRAIPDRFKINLAGKVNPAPIRYGFMVGLMIAPFLDANICCTFCNFAHTQNIINALFGNFTGISHWTSFTAVSFVLWFVVLGLFTKGGRGWCNFVCPAGGLMNLFHTLGARFNFTKKVKIDKQACNNCNLCIPVCPAWAIREKEEKIDVNLHVCNACLDCIQVCNQNAVSFG